MKKKKIAKMSRKQINGKKGLKKCINQFTYFKPCIRSYVINKMALNGINNYKIYF